MKKAHEHEHSENHKNEDKSNENEIKNENQAENKNEESNKSEKEQNAQNELLNKLNEEQKEEIIKKYIKLIQENADLKNAVLIKEKEYNELIDKYKRTLAEMENLRKRTVLDKQESLKYANFNIINDFISLLDDFQRAIDSAKKDEKTELNHFVEGIELIEKQFVDLLFKKYGTKSIGEKGELFNPSNHQALMMEEGDFDDEIVLEVFRKGYALHDRVVRHAQVKVGKPKC